MANGLIMGTRVDTTADEEANMYILNHFLELIFGSY